MIKPNLLDRLIAVVSPRAAVQRLAARGTFEAFSGRGADGAGTSPTNGRWATIARSPDSDIIRGLPRQRAESRELRALNPIASGAIDTNLNRVVGTGLVPVPDPDIAVLGWTEDEADAFKQQWLREFSLWADSKTCTLDGTQTFYERQALVLGARLESGDCFTLLPDAAPTPTQPYRLRLQTIEADRVGNPMGSTDRVDQVAGIRLTNGAPTAAHVYRQHPGSTLATGNKFVGDWIEYIGRSGRRRILHHYRPTRPEQTRGVPYLAPVIQAIKDLGRYTEAEITAAVLSAFYTVFIETDSGSGPAPVYGAQPPTGQQNDADPAAGAEMAMAPGAVIGLAKGEKATFADPKRPNTAYEPFVMGILKLVGMGLNLPVELLTKAFNSSYSASKAALLDAWQHFRTERAWLVNTFCQPVYETLMAEAVASGRISAPGFFENPLIRWAYTRATWHGDSQGSINPKDEVAAYRDAIDSNLMTHEFAEWQLWGTDWHRTFSAKKRERRMIDAAGLTPAPKAGAAAPTPRPAPAPGAISTEADTAAAAA